MTTPTQPDGTQAPVSTPEQGQPKASGTAPVYVTRDDLTQFKTELESLFKDKVNRGVQSTTDELIHKKVRGELKKWQDTITKLEKAGIQVSPEQANSLKQQAVFDAYLDTPGTQPQPPGQGAQPEPGAGSEPPLTPLQQQVTETAFEIMETLGVEIEDNDPEVELIQKASSGTPKQFYAAVREACKAKQARLSQPAAPNPARMPGLATGAQGAANPIGSITDPMTLIRMGLNGK